MFKEPVNRNYCATVTKLATILPLEGCDNIAAAIIFGNSVIVDKKSMPGTIGVYFPPETQLSEEFLHNNNLYHDPTLNADQDKKGYFEKNGRIKVAKFKGNKSEGLWLPITCFDYLKLDSKTNWDSLENADFDEINNKVICKKYIPGGRKASNPSSKKANKKIVKKFNRLVENQFRLHNDTLNFRRNAASIKPTDFISISNKMHGTSCVAGKILVKNPLGRVKTLLKKVVPEISDTYYDIVYSSRTVVKNKYINNKSDGGFYGYDLWKDIADKLKDSLLDGITIYAEAVGYLPTGAAIQSKYDYGCKPNQFEIYVYRITFTNVSGKMIEFSWPQIKEYCTKFGINHVKEFYYGMAKDYCPSIPVDLHWHENFLNKLEKDFMLDRDCPLCKNKVPEEGIVISVETLFERISYKLKNFRFLDKERKDNDAEVIDLETEQALDTTDGIDEA